GVIVIGSGLIAWRTQRDQPATVRLALLAAILLPIEVVVGGLQVLTQLSGWAQTLHVAPGASIWSALVGLTVVAYYTARTSPVAATEAPGQGAGTGPVAPTARPGPGAGSGPGDLRPIGSSAVASAASSRRASIRAYIALTK